MATPPSSAPAARAELRRRVDGVTLSILAGVALAALALLRTAIALLTSPGATWRVLLPVLLLALPLLGAGALAGWLLGPATGSIRRWAGEQAGGPS